MSHNLKKFSRKIPSEIGNESKRLKRRLFLNKYLPIALNKCNNSYRKLFDEEIFHRLNQPDDLDRPARSIKEKIFRLMWILLNEHRWSDAARLFHYALNHCDVSTAWIWRIAFHMLHCTNKTKHLDEIYSLLNSFAVWDLENVTLEYTYFKLKNKQFQDVLDKKFKVRFVGRSEALRKKQQPELEYASRLKSLYDGIAHYALWKEAKDQTIVNQTKLQDDENEDEEDHLELLSSKHANSATSLFSGVEFLIKQGIICDIFVTKYVELLICQNILPPAERILQEYHQYCPENPNTCLYLSQFYAEHVTNGPQPDWITDELHWSSEYWKRVIPPAPTTQEFESTPLCLCIQRNIDCGRREVGLQLLFNLLDYPDWKFEEAPWVMLKSLIESHSDNELLKPFWELRKSWWVDCQFRNFDHRYQKRSLPSSVYEVAFLLSSE